MGNLVTGIVLAGGKSTRMGGDKGLVKLNDKPLVSYAIRTLENAGCKVIISSNNPVYKQFGYPVIPDEVTGIGPLGGIYSALRVSNTHRNVVLSCDMPLVPADLIRFLLNETTDFQSVVPMYNGYTEPLCGCYSKEVTEIIGALIAKRSYKMQNLLKNLKTNCIEITREFSFFREEMFVNINDPDQLKKIEAELDGR
jgi:molybdopterin-guanine dinucleotide biosynthesis protein A